MIENDHVPAMMRAPSVGSVYHCFVIQMQHFAVIVEHLVSWFEMVERCKQIHGNDISLHQIYIVVEWCGNRNFEKSTTNTRRKKGNLPIGSTKFRFCPWRYGVSPLLW